MTSDKQDADHSNKAGQAISSPCIRNCCLDHNDICLGCYRTLEEIRHWVESTAQQKQNILALCEARRQGDRKG
ncbi:MAG: DUF1289 domain-containing protein [Oleibacter sp.]|nr:DUF1289 domain-containing protein [Thalassolituus sp.]|tara:strand:+ start:2083 stop:2301 length:219 start_codon:yes stop_codon:yes gene_type:complete